MQNNLKLKKDLDYLFLNSTLSTKLRILLAIDEIGPNFEDNTLRDSISSFVKNLTKINAKK